MMRLHRGADRSAWATRLPAPYLLQDTLAGEEFAAFVDARVPTTIRQRASLAKSLISEGCRHVVLVGDDAAPWRDEIRSASAARFANLVEPADRMVTVTTFEPSAIDVAIDAFVNGIGSGNFKASRFLLIGLGDDPERAGAVENAMAAAFRGESAPRLSSTPPMRYRTLNPLLAPMPATPSTSSPGRLAAAATSAPAPVSARPCTVAEVGTRHTFLIEAGRWSMVGRLCDAYGRSVSIDREVDVQHRQDRWLVQGWIGEFPLRSDVRALEPGSVATTWQTQSGRLGTVDGNLAMIDDVLVMTFASSDGMHRGSEYLRIEDDDRYVVHGALFSGPILVNTWTAELRRQAR